jgi:hypothetical protein
MNPYLLLYPISLGLLSRWHGSGVGPQKAYKSLAYATPYALSIALSTGSWFWTLFVLLTTAALKSAPHEAFLDDGFLTSEPQYTSWLTRITDVLTARSARDTTRWCSVGWAVKGYMIALPSAMAFSNIHDAHRSLQLLACGTLSSVIGYALGWTVLRNRLLQATEWGELLSGLVAGFGFV